MSSKSFSFKNYDCVGFDLDNTVALYNIADMSELIYDNFVKFLTEQRGYAGKHLSLSLESGLAFIQKGLAMDFQRGNVVKLGPGGKVLRASHGTKMLSDEKLVNAYGAERVWDDAKKFTDDILEAWNGPLTKKIRCVFSYFDVATVLVFARIVDTLVETGGKPDYLFLESDLVAALADMYKKEAFKEDSGNYFPALKANPLKYIKKSPPETVTILKRLKEAGKMVYLITASSQDFATFTASTALGPSWTDLFDIIIFFARKPNFFRMDRPFLQIEDSIEGEPIALSKSGKIYSQGNWGELRKFLEKTLGRTDLKSVYIGDGIVQDVVAPVVCNCCDTVCVTEEENQPNEPIIGVSPIWGDYFSTDGQETLWKCITDKYATLSIDSMPCLLNHFE